MPNSTIGSAGSSLPHGTPLREDVAAVLSSVERMGELPAEAWARVLEAAQHLPDGDLRRLVVALGMALDRSRRGRLNA